MVAARPHMYNQFKTKAGQNARRIRIGRKYNAAVEGWWKFAKPFACCVTRQNRLLGNGFFHLAAISCHQMRSLKSSSKRQ